MLASKLLAVPDLMGPARVGSEGFEPPKSSDN